MEFFASCPTGFEDALADELNALGLAQVRKLKGRVSFTGQVIDGERACLWSRLASRILVVIDRFDARNADALYARHTRDCLGRDPGRRRHHRRHRSWHQMTTCETPALAPCA